MSLTPSPTDAAFEAHWKHRLINLLKAELISGRIIAKDFWTVAVTWATAQERERCAKIADDEADEFDHALGASKVGARKAHTIARKIRATPPREG